MGSVLALQDTRGQVPRSSRWLVLLAGVQVPPPSRLDASTHTEGGWVAFCRGKFYTHETVQ
jgi:hypothetical protein